VAERLTSIPGASDVFLGGIVAYANTVKERELGVPAATLAEHGAVSAETAEAMAAGIRKRLSADIGLAVTGIAGPDGGTPDKPVGLVYLAAGDVSVYRPDGTLLRTIEVPERPLQVVFGGPDGRTLFMPARHGLYAVHLQ
jgi:nicotinamide-nucleotide amidase